MKRYLVLGAVSVGLFFFSLPASADAYLKESQSRPLLGTVVNIEVCYVDGRQDAVKTALEHTWQRLEEINVRMNNYDPQSDVSAINQSAGKMVKVHEDVYRLVGLSLGLREKTGGVFDITVGPLIRLWKKAGKVNVYPALEELKEAKTHMGPDKIIMDLDTSVGLKDPEAELDLGGDAQGFAADEAARVLKSERFHNFMVDAGGEIYAAGTNCEGRAWRIGIQDPDRRDRLMDAIEVGNVAVSTSGDYEKYVTIQGQKWSHIINPVTGYPQNGVASATVIAPTAVEADALSTALCILGPMAGLDLIKSLGEDYDALIVFRRDKEKYEWHSTEGYETRRVDRNK